MDILGNTLICFPLWELDEKIDTTLMSVHWTYGYDQQLISLA